MAQTPPKDIEKSIDSLQRVHALVSALALGEAVRRLIINPGAADAAFNASALPQFIALTCTIVPFYHGMHRHLEDTYLFAKDLSHPKGVLLIDFVVFLVEACTFFALASLFKSDGFFWVLAALLMFDGIWSGLTALITKTTQFRWCVLNFFAAIAMFVILSLDVFRHGMEVWLLALVAAIRTILDYVRHWRFYFPFADDKAAGTILEVAILYVRHGSEAAFEVAFAEARPLIEAIPGFLGLDLQRCVEKPNQYILLVRWRLEDHIEGFRESPQYGRWKELLHHFYDPLPTAEHYRTAGITPPP